MGWGVAVNVLVSGDEMELSLGEVKSRLDFSQSEGAIDFGGIAF